MHFIPLADLFRVSLFNQKIDLNQPVWTKTVRLTHWLVATGVLINMFNDTGDTHRMIGYLCLGLVALRILHGLSKHAPVSSSFYLPRFTAIKQHLHELLSAKVASHPGHNPLGQWAVYAIWLLIGLLAFTGWLSRTDAYWGEDWPVDWHGYFADALLALVLLHVAAVLLMSKLTRKNLIKQMVTGKDESS